MAAALIALGSNLGDSTSILQQAINALDRTPEIAVLQRSRWHRTAPIGGPAGQGEFINAAIRVQTSLAASQLHACLRQVETRLGRQRRQRWAARLVDLDLLLFDELVLKTPELTLPHPRMAFRRFVLEPAAEVGGGMRHPLIGWTVQQLLDHLNHSAEYVAVAGLPGLGRTQLARDAAQATSLRLIQDPARDLTDLPVDAAAELQIVRRRAASLSATAWAAQPAGAISDYWIGQSLVYLQLQRYSESAAADKCDQLWQMATDGVVPPKLLAWLNQPPADVDRQSLAEPHAAPLDRKIWEQVVATRYRGPLLQLDAAQPDRALADLVAAIQAMR